MKRAAGLLCLVPLLLALPAVAQDSPDPFGPSTLQARALRGLTGEVATLILRAEPGGELAIEALAVPLGTEADPAADGSPRRRVSVLVEIDGTSFLELNQSELVRVEVYLYALSREGFAVADYRAEVAAVDIEKLGEVVWQSGLKYYGELALPPGAYRLRALVRNFQSKAAGLVEIPLDVPPTSSGPEVSAPLVPDPTFREPWVPVRAWRDDLLAGLVDEPVDGLHRSTGRSYPFSFREAAIRPSARPVLAPGRQSSLFLRTRHVTPDAELELEILPGTGSGTEPLAIVPLEVIERQTIGGLETIEAQVVPPAGLSPGPIALRARIRQGGQTIVSSLTSGHVMSAEIHDPNVLWSDLRWRGSGETGTSAAASEAPVREAPSQGRGGRKSNKIAASFRQVLAEITDLEPTVAMGRLVDFETGVLKEGSRKASALLQVAEFQVAQELAETDPESLVPLMQLYQDLYLAYRGRRMFSLGTHSRVLMERIAELYAEAGGTQGSRIVAARALTSLGGYLQAGGLAATSQRLFRRALELDPTSRSAMLALACGYERLGVYARAKEVLQLLVAAHPSSAEGWLRLALSSGRLGNRLQARELLQKVVALDAPTWITSLAYEELARIHLFLDQPDEALELLERLPEPSDGTVVLTAYLYDRLGSPRKSLALLEEIEAEPGSAPSPRKRYDGWPEDELDATRRALREAADVRLGRLKDLIREGAPS